MVERAGGGGPPAPAARLIAVGDELMSGRTADTDGALVARALGERGVRVERIAVVPDLAEAVGEALSATRPGDLVVLIGGLGSTPDDLTREAVAAWAAVPLREHPESRRRLQGLAAARGFAYGDSLARQALAPAGLEPVTNPVGSAPALVGRLRERALALLPGVPAELRALLPAVLARLAAAGALPSPLPGVLLRTAQMAENALVGLCRPVREAFPGLEWSWTLVRWGVDVTVRARGPVPAGAGAAAATAGRAGTPELAAVAARLRQRLGRSVWAEAPVELPQVVLDLAAARGLSLAVAESCTAGLLGARLTEPPGASAAFRGGVLAYADDVKRDLLDVPAALLAEHGAVSRAVAEAMAVGCRRRLGADVALSITGVAGPAGGSEAKPVGTTWLGLADPAGVVARRYRFPGDRNRNRHLAVAAALDTLRRRLQAPDAAPWLAADTWGRDA